MTSHYEESVGEARALLGRARSVAEDEVGVLALALARALLAASEASAEAEERERAERLSSLMNDRAGQVFATALTDRAHRSTNGARLVAEVQRLVSWLGIPRSLQRWDRLELRALQRFGASLPELTARAVERRIYEDAAPYIAPAEPEELAAFLRARRLLDVQVNVNQLGEEVLGRADEQRFLDRYVDLLARPEVDTISIKLSSLDSHVDVSAWERTLARLEHKLERVYRAALEHRAPRRDGMLAPKLVYLDMEAYRELDLTFELFCRVLARPEFSGLSAGLVLQAYVPDSHAYQHRLVDWARERVAKGGAPVRLRLVKGANLMMERIEASLRGWPVATYGSKAEVDASFKRMLGFGVLPEHARVVELGVGSHNLFDVAYTLVLRARHGTEQRVEPEMLEGMADPLRRVVQRVAGRVLVYAPSVARRDFPSAVAYLVRRLDENTSEQNFLRHSFAMRVGDANFELEQRRFLEALDAVPHVGTEPRRRPSRPEAEATDTTLFENEPDSDFSQREQREWLRALLAAGPQSYGTLSSRVAGRALDGELRRGFDPSLPGHVPYEYRVLDRKAVERAIEKAHAGAAAWAAVASEERERLVLEVAQALRRSRAELVLAMLTDVGKSVLEADAEVSEAIDFAEYYARQQQRLRERFELEPKGLVVVTPPWNFPLAIALGSVLAALVAGNAVLLKPPPESVLVQARAAELCWQAGIPEQALGLVLVDDAQADPLIRDERVAAVVLTGGTETAKLFRRMRPGLDLIAETGGKNAVIVSAMSDREQAIAHVVRAAFGYAGQKCSAASLLVLEREVWRSASFRDKLVDAASSLPLGSAWELGNVVTPLIRPPAGALARALQEIDPGESWLLEPQSSPDNPRLVGPAIRWGVAPGSFLHQTELFGPVLGVMEARDFEHALELARGSPYGLTAGLESLDLEEQRLFLEHMPAGNLYVNRPITGAIVGRQPFGGIKASSFGRGFKAGGPNSLLGLSRVLAERSGVRWTGVALSAGPRAPERLTPASVAPTLPRPDLGPLGAVIERVERSASEADRARLLARLDRYERAYREEIAPRHAQDSVLGYADEFMYRPARVLVVAAADASEVDLASTLFAARLAGAELGLVLHSGLAAPAFEPLELLDARRFTSAAELELSAYDRLRFVGSSGAREFDEIGLELAQIETEPVHDSGYVELRRYVLEQARSVALHRHGNLGLSPIVRERVLSRPGGGLLY